MKILIVEDEKLLADSLRDMLQQKGFQVEVAYDGITGRDYAELGIYDLLILGLTKGERSFFVNKALQILKIKR